MHPRFLQSMIHSEKSTDLAVWTEYTFNINDIYNEYTQFNNTYLPGEFTDHLVREFNRRVYNLGFYELMWTPYDAGFRVIF